MSESKKIAMYKGIPIMCPDINTSVELGKYVHDILNFSKPAMNEDERNFITSKLVNNFPAIIQLNDKAMEIIDALPDYAKDVWIMEKNGTIESIRVYPDTKAKLIAAFSGSCALLNQIAGKYVKGNQPIESMDLSLIDFVQFTNKILMLAPVLYTFTKDYIENPSA